MDSTDSSSLSSPYSTSSSSECRRPARSPLAPSWRSWHCGLWSTYRSRLRDPTTDQRRGCVLVFSLLPDLHSPSKSRKRVLTQVRPITASRSSGESQSDPASDSANRVVLAPGRVSRDCWCATVWYVNVLAVVHLLWLTEWEIVGTGAAFIEFYFSSSLLSLIL